MTGLATLALLTIIRRVSTGQTRVITLLLVIASTATVIFTEAMRPALRASVSHTKGGHQT